VLDRDGLRIGRVDGLILRFRGGEPPEVAAIEVGLAALLRRFGRRVAEAAARWERRLGVGSGEPLRVEAERITHVGKDVEVELEGGRTNALAWERWLRKKVIGRIPGAESK
jgi:hypothetical protein